MISTLAHARVHTHTCAHTHTHRFFNSNVIEKFSKKIRLVIFLKVMLN